MRYTRNCLFLKLLIRYPLDILTPNFCVGVLRPSFVTGV